MQLRQESVPPVRAQVSCACRKVLAGSGDSRFQIQRAFAHCAGEATIEGEEAWIEQHCAHESGGRKWAEQCGCGLSRLRRRSSSSSSPKQER